MSELADLPTWWFEIKEVSAGVYAITGRDLAGHIISKKGTDPDSLLAECRREASEIGPTGKGLGQATTLKRFWFNFEKVAGLSAINIGCGVTALDRGDAERLLMHSMFKDGPLPRVTSCIENVDVSALDPRHVLPNIGQVVVRGIWFPQGY